MESSTESLKPFGEATDLVWSLRNVGFHGSHERETRYGNAMKWQSRVNGNDVTGTSL